MPDKPFDYRQAATSLSSTGRMSLLYHQAGKCVKNSIPIHTFADWEENHPGFLEADLVSHCGESTEGFYLTTLSTVDVATGWSECVGVWGKRQELAATYYGLNPVFLLRQINENLDCLWDMAERPTYQQRRVKTCEVSVT